MFQAYIQQRELSHGVGRQYRAAERMYMKLLLEYKRRQYQLVHARELAEQAKQMEKERMLQAEKDRLALAAKKAEEQAAKCRKKVFMH